MTQLISTHSTGTYARGSAYYGEGTGPIQMDDVGCNGDESFLLNCTHNTDNNCGHGDDAGVECPGEQWVNNLFIPDILFVLQYHPANREHVSLKPPVQQASVFAG